MATNIPPLGATRKARGSSITFKLGHHDSIKFSDGLQKAVFEILPSQDPLDNPDFNAVDYINNMFPDGR